MPAVAVIPAPLAYVKVAAVKTLVVVVEWRSWTVYASKRFSPPTISWSEF